MVTKAFFPKQSIKLRRLNNNKIKEIEILQRQINNFK